MVTDQSSGYLTDEDEIKVIWLPKKAWIFFQPSQFLKYRSCINWILNNFTWYILNASNHQCRRQIALHQKPFTKENRENLSTYVYALI